MMELRAMADDKPLTDVIAELRDGGNGNEDVIVEWRNVRMAATPSGVLIISATEAVPLEEVFSRLLAALDKD